jgi:uncharacterized protein (TIGR02145 family)
MMLDGKYADDSKTSATWDETWVSGNYFSTGAPGTTANAGKNNARGSGSRGICPLGWHVPTDYEWANLLDKVDGNGTGTTFTVNQTSTGYWGTDAGMKLKSAATYTGTDPGDGSWQEHANRGINATGFGAVAGGHRYYSGSQFLNRSRYGIYWSSSVGDNTNVWYREFYYDSKQVYRYFSFRANGMSVRCVRN